MSEDGSLVITGSADRVRQPQHWKSNKLPTCIEAVLGGVGVFTGIEAVLRAVVLTGIEAVLRAVVLTGIEAVLGGVGVLTGVYVGVLQWVVGILEGDHIGVVSSKGVAWILASFVVPIEVSLV